MANERLPLLRGRITSVEAYEAPQRGGGSPPTMPSLDPKAHRTKLLQQLDDIAQQVSARDATTRDELATREIIAVRPVPAVPIQEQVARKLRQAFDAADSSGTGTITREQARAAGLGFVAGHFDSIDTARRGAVSFEDLKRFLREQGAKID